MLVVAVQRPGDFGIVDVPQPEPGQFQALTRVLTCGICGTDRSIVSGAFPLHAYPCLLGHEAIGVVKAVGPGVTSLAPGDLVLRPNAVPPGQKTAGYNSQWGGFAEWGVVWDREALLARSRHEQNYTVPGSALQQQKMPHSFDPIDAAMFITFKECLSTLRRLASLASKEVLVMGTGPVALAFVQASRLLGARSVGVLGRRPEALARFLHLGADAMFNIQAGDIQKAVRDWTHRRGVQLVVDTTGAADIIGISPALLCDEGEVVLYGVGPAKTVPLNIGFGQTASNFAVRRINPQEHAVHEEALAALAAGSIDLKAPLSHVMPLKAVKEAFALLDRREAWKIVIDMKGGN